MESGRKREWSGAVLARDSSMDGEFVYGVSSTRFYCRPSCPARKPREDRLVFFTSSQSARAAGFRPCLRCRPDEAVAGDPHGKMVARLSRFIDTYDSPARPLTLAVMSGYMKLCPHHLQRAFSKISILVGKAGWATWVQ